jgi:hypothetical protein
MLNSVVGNGHEITGRCGPEGHRNELGPIAPVECEDVVIRPGRAKVDSAFISSGDIEPPRGCVEAFRERQIRRADAITGKRVIAEHVPNG